MSGTADRLAEALQDWASLPDALACLPYVQRQAVAEALAPVVDGIVADELDSIVGFAYEAYGGMLYGTACDVVDEAHRRAAALRGQGGES